MWIVEGAMSTRWSHSQQPDFQNPHQTRQTHRRRDRAPTRPAAAGSDRPYGPPSHAHWDRQSGHLRNKARSGAHHMAEVAHMTGLC